MSASQRPPTCELPSLKDVLELPCISHGKPRILAGKEFLGRTIRWVHISDLIDIAGLLAGGEMILSTGLGLPAARDSLRHYVRSLSDVDVGALVIELGGKLSELPKALVEEAHASDLPLIVLERETRFVDVTEAVHTLIVDARVGQLERSELIHRQFTELTVEGAPPEAIVSAAAELCGHPVILENLAHRVVTFATGTAPPETLLRNWERRSRSARADNAIIQVEPDESWVAVPVGARGDNWGRLVAVASEPASDTALVLERAATALALNRLSVRDDTSVKVRAHQEVLSQIVDRSYSSVGSLNSQAAALGVPLEGRVLVGVSINFEGVARREALKSDYEKSEDLLKLDYVEEVLESAETQFSALIDDHKPATVRLLVSLRPDVDLSTVLASFARALHKGIARSARPHTPIVGVGSPVTDVREARRSLAEADYVSSASFASRRQKPYYQLTDVRVRGLIHALRDDNRLQNFVELELAPLIEFDFDHGTDHIGTLSTYLDQGHNKTQTAGKLHLSRPALYDRLELIGNVLDADLDDPETCLSLHVAILGLQSIRTGDWHKTARNWPEFVS